MNKNLFFCFCIVLSLVGCDMNSDLPPISITVQQPQPTPSTPAPATPPTVSYPVVHSQGQPAPLSTNTSGISITYNPIQSVQAGPGRVIANMKLTNNAGSNVTRVLVKLKLTTNDSNVQGGFVLYVDGNPVESRDYSELYGNGLIEIDAWGFNIVSEANISVQLYTDHGTNDNVQATLLRVQTDTGVDSSTHQFINVLCG